MCHRAYVCKGLHAVCRQSALHVHYLATARILIVAELREHAVDYKIIGRLRMESIDHREI